MENSDRRVVLGLSGGVDSAVAARLLQRTGYEAVSYTHLNYLPQLRVMLLSLRANNPGLGCRVFLLHRSIPELSLIHIWTTP